MNGRLLMNIISLHWRNKFLPTKPFSSTTNEDVRVRFAPSPTGHIHLGGLRTALYNHLFAKSKNGTTILRIEDTDRTRLVKGATENIIEELNWCGIKFDEGPYFQSERKELYRKHAEELIESGAAYYCFCSNTRLDLLRKELIKNGEIVKYDNKCRSLSKEEVDAKLKNEENYCIRFKLSDKVVSFVDLIHGDYSCNLLQVEGDPIILKTDGFPTYHLANVVDDHHMNISHVLRGSEWLGSTIKHLLLFKAFNWKPPLYGHLPLLLNSDGTKFSKRQNDLQLGHLREMGFFPNAIVNVVTRAGGGFEIKHEDRDEKNFTIDEFIKMFNLSKVHRNSCKLPLERLEGSNRLEIKRMMQDSSDCKTLIKLIQNCIQKHFSNRDLKVNVDDEYILKVLDIALERIYKIEDLLSVDFSFMWVIPEYKFVEGKSLTLEGMTELIKQLDGANWSREQLNVFFKEFSKAQNIVYRELMGSLRLILTGIKDGPSVAEIMILLGKESSMERLSKSLSKAIPKN